jgi:hypothetical protein
MAKVALDLSQFKSAGVYTIEVDQSERIQVTTQSLRLLPGFSTQGPFNAPVFIRSTKDLARFYGNNDVKLERKGSFFHRSITTSLLTAPVFAINLLNVNSTPGVANTDVVDFVALSVDASKANASVASDMFVNFFNRERFWKPDADYLQGVVNNSLSAANNLSSALISLANVGTKNLSFIVRKAVGLQGYSVYAKDWYGTAGNIPYEWIRPYDLMKDYFIQVIAFEGNWTEYSDLSIDPYYSTYFNANGLIPAQINNFINLPQVNLVGSWVGSIIPDFKDGTGTEQYIETIVNGATALTGVLMNVNQEALDQLTWNNDAQKWVAGDETSVDAATYLVDLVGHSWCGKGLTGDVSASFLSYNINVSSNVLHNSVAATVWPIGDTTFKSYSIDSSVNATYITVGSLVKTKDSSNAPGVTYVTGKTFDGSAYVITTAEPVSAPLIVQKTIDDASITASYKFINLDGLHLTNKHLPGFSTSGTQDAEAGLVKIYGMLHEEGILRGLTNPDMINYRYVVDTMAYGLQANMGGKSYLSSLAKKRGKCTAIISAPSIKQFSSAQNPYFCETFTSGVDPVPIFSTEFIAAGGNPDMPRSFRFTLPSEDLGSKYCGVFGPFLKYNENGKLIDVPPAADVANSYVRKFLGGNPYAIVANREGTLANPLLSGLEYALDQTDRDYLEPFGYNSIIQRPATGQIMIYANVTGFQDVKSDYNNLHVRELLNTIEIQIEEILKNYVFDFNNPVTRLNIVNSVAPVLESVKDSGAVYKYELIMDDTNNSGAIIADGFGIIDVNLWITGALTKIIAKYKVNSAGGVSSGGFVTM